MFFFSLISYDREAFVGDFTYGELPGMAGRLVYGGGVGGGTCLREFDRLMGGLREVGVGGKILVGGGRGGGIILYRVGDLRSEGTGGGGRLVYSGAGGGGG
jgi:hypothetical protein